MSFNLATAWEAIAEECPDADALVAEGSTISWADFEAQASRLASGLAELGVGPGDKVGLHMYNCPEYLLATFAAFKLRAVPFNVNFRYLDHELRYLLDNADARVVISHESLSDLTCELAPDLPQLRAVVEVGVEVGAEVGSGNGSCAVPFDELGGAAPYPIVERSGDDLWFLYTGGTTGHPKAVMWPHSSLVGTMAATYRRFGMDAPESVEDVIAVARAVHGGYYGGPQRLLPAAPLMHGTSSLTSLHTLNEAGTVVTMPARSFDADELWTTVAAAGVTNLTIVGDVFGRPMADALERATAAGEPYDLSTLRGILSSGVMWSQEVKDALLEHHDMILIDTLGSSEGVGIGGSVARRGRAGRTAGFRLGPNAAVFNEVGEPVEPGSGEVGVLAVGGPIPVGYYKDPEKSAATFRTLGDRVWSVAGDHAVVEADGAITLLGRGSASINTGGEKVFPEEVEEVLKTHPAVVDCLVVGVPDERWGQAVTAVVAGDDSQLVAADLAKYAKTQLAGYKCPKHVVVVDAVVRGPNGKPDYRWAAEAAAAAVGSS